MHPRIPYSIYPLGDTAITVGFDNRIAEEVNDRVMALRDSLLQEPIEGLVELVPAFCTLTVFYDMAKLRNRMGAGFTAYAYIKEALEKRLALPFNSNINEERLVRIPVCYQGAFAPDMEELVKFSGLPAEEIIRIHCEKQYRVYMLGFLPGFAYMGPLDPRISMPRKTSPRTTAAGSVGIAGLQTGIYPLQSPGGWQIIGRTPLRMFDAGRENCALLRPGDRVEFYEVGEEEMNRGIIEQMNRGLREQGSR